MMGALEAGGMPLLVDRHRSADEHNPRGYFEHRAVLGLADSSDWLSGHQGEAVKVLSHLLRHLPVCAVPTKILMMIRPFSEIVASQNAMLKLASVSPDLERLLGRDFAQTSNWVKEQTFLEVLEVNFHALLASPNQECRRVARFLGVPLNIEAMADVVDVSLYRQRGAS